jgi:FSR family fosmidomycin resistance protein-like MFS transporter
MTAQPATVERPEAPSVEPLHASTPPSPTRFHVMRNKPLMTLMLGHLTLDMYAGILPVLYPLLQDDFDLNLKTVGYVSFAYSGAASLSQPLFGWIADRFGTRFIGLALLWTACTYAFIGFAPSFAILVLLAGLAGLGSGAYHPMGALNASAVISDEQRNAAMSIYVTGGTLGVAIGPLVGALVFYFFGIHGTLVTVLPGAGIAILMLFEMRTIALRVKRRSKTQQFAHIPIPVGPLAVVIGMMMLRSWTMFGIQSFIPTWYEDMGYDAWFYSSLATTLLLTSALGTVGSGHLADRYGRRVLLIGSAVLSVPSILLFAQFPGVPAFFTASMMGILFASTGPLLLVIAQQLMIGRAGMASGLILGLGFVMGAIGVPVMGAFADAYGMQNAMRAQAVVGALSVIVAWMLPTERDIRRLTETKAAAVPATA